MRRTRLFLSVLCLGVCELILTSCAFPTDLFFEPPPVTPPAAELLATPTQTLQPTPSDTPIPPTPIPCTYAWTSKDLPDETALVQEALKRAEMGVVDVALSAYGENCVDSLNNKIISFAAIETDFYYSVPVNNLNDKAAMGNWTAQLLKITQQFPPGKVPGPQYGYVAIVFGDGRDETRLWFQIEAGMRGLEKGLSGETLFNALAPAQ